MALPRPRELSITEQWIKDRLDLNDDTLVAVRSLALPGTYQYKVNRLGRSLLSFTRLKHLDLSRNALESLKGLNHLSMLETLNLYYNKIPDLREVFRLRHNTKLKEIDLRLNPITKHEPDYRLFIVHMLPSLRKLDDRIVSEGERRAALMHFDSDQAHGFQDSIRSSIITPPSSPPPPDYIASRKALVRSLAPTRTGLGADTEELLELMTERNSHLMHHNPSSPQQTSAKKHVSKETPPTQVQPVVNEFADEYQAYTERRPLLHFTPCPQEKQEEDDGNQEEEEEENVMECTSAEDFAEHIANKVQRHMNNHSSTTEKLKEEVYDSIQKWLKALHSEHREEEEREEVSSMKRRLQAQADELAELRKMVTNGEEVQEMLRQAHSQLDDMRAHCQELMEENKLLKESSTDRVTNEHLLTQSITDINTVKVSQQQVLSEVHQLARTLTQHLTMADKQQELAALLQESHQCLMVAHDHILKQDEARQQQHCQEVNQMKNNYDMLRRTMGLIQTTPTNTT